MESEPEKFQRTYKRVSMDNMYNNLVKGKGDFLIRRGTECNELIFDGLHNVYATASKNFASNKIFLFNLVACDVRKFLKTNPFVELPPKKDVTFYSYTYDLEEGSLTGTDLDHAYWRIAYAKGYISKKTYNYGLDETAKPLRLATLSVLGREKVFEKWENGEYGCSSLSDGIAEYAVADNQRRAVEEQRGAQAGCDLTRTWRGALL